MTSRCLTLILLTIFSNSFAQDSLVFIKDISFTSPFEKKVFYDYQAKKSPDAFTLLMANGALLNEQQIENAKTQFYSFLSSFENPKFAAKKNDKKVKEVVSGIQDRFLKKYKSDSRFEEIFHNGNFNEVTGTALYCLAFEKLNIPYEIREEADNVYVMAYPQSNNIMIESTLSSVSFITFDNIYKQEFVQAMRKQKIISEQEILKSSTHELFEQYYFNNKLNTTLVGLTGLHYLQEGMILLENEEYEKAFSQFEKSYWFSQSPKSSYLLMQSGAQAFLKHPNRDLEHARLLGKVSRYKATGTTDEMIVGEYFKVIKDLLFDKQQNEKLSNYYAVLLENVHNVQTERELRFIHEYEQGRFLYNQARFTEALPYFEKTLSLKPSNQDASNIFIGTLGNLANSQIQNEDFSIKLAGYENTFPSLKENNSFNALLGASYLVQFALLYESEKVNAGDDYRKKFETLYEAHKDLNINSVLIGKAYSTAAVYFFRKGQSKKALEYLSIGLKISPDNYELLSRQRMIRQ